MGEGEVARVSWLLYAVKLLTRLAGADESIAIGNEPKLSPQDWQLHNELVGFLVDDAIGEFEAIGFLSSKVLQ